MGERRGAKARSFPDLAARDRDFLLATMMKPSSLGGNRGSLGGTGWRRSSRGCSSTSVGGGGGISGDNNGSFGWRGRGVSSGSGGREWCMEASGLAGWFG